MPMLAAADRRPTMVAWNVKSYGYEVATLDQEGQILDSYDGEPGADWNETVKLARQTANETAEEHGIPLRKGKVFRDPDLMLSLAELRKIP
jgi:hypothetical protein